MTQQSPLHPTDGIDKKKGKATALDRLIGERLLNIRKQSNFTQEDVANHIGVSKQQFQKYEKGDNRITLSKAVEFAEFLGISIKDITNNLTAQGLADGQDQAAFEPLNPKTVLKQKEINELIKSYNAIDDDEKRSNFVKAAKEMAKALSN